MKQQLYYKLGGEVKALFEGEDKKLYINDGNGNMVLIEDRLDPKPTTNPIIIQSTHVNPRYYSEFIDAVEKREPITYRHLTREGHLKLAGLERNRFYLISYRNRPFWYYTGEGWVNLDEPKYV